MCIRDSCSVGQWATYGLGQVFEAGTVSGAEQTAAICYIPTVRLELHSFYQNGLMKCPLEKYGTEVDAEACHEDMRFAPREMKGLPSATKCLGINSNATKMSVCRQGIATECTDKNVFSSCTTCRLQSKKTCLVWFVNSVNRLHFSHNSQACLLDRQYKT